MHAFPLKLCDCRPDAVWLAPRIEQIEQISLRNGNEGKQIAAMEWCKWRDRETHFQIHKCILFNLLDAIKMEC